MLKLFENLKPLVNPKSKLVIDNRVFRMHYRMTVILLFGFSAVVTTKQYVGNPIECLMDEKAKIPKDFMEAYCWVHSTYTIQNLTNAEEGTEVAHPGVGLTQKGDEIKFHRYYQWVSVILFFQALLFYGPHFLWKAWEGNRVKMLVEDLGKIISDDKMTLEKRNEGIEKHRKLVVDYFVRYSWKSSNLYAFRYFFCELMNATNVVMQLALINAYLGFEFTTYGMNVMIFTETDPFRRSDPMARVFPKVTKCIFRRYGPGGNIVPYDALCLLPVNVFNEKFYVFLYFWFIILATISVMSMLIRILSCTVQKLRHHMLLSKARLADSASVVIVGKSFGVGDWFLLNQIERNIEAVIFRDLIQDLAHRFKDNGKMKV